MLTGGTALISVGVIVVVLLSVAAWWTFLRRCTCQREAPLASLGALRKVTAGAQREQARGSTTSIALGRPATSRTLRGLSMTPRPPT